MKELAKETNKKQDIFVIYNGIDINEFKEKVQKKKRKNEKLILISTGRLIERKGYEYLIEAISKMKDVELRLIGKGDLENELREKARDLKSNVEFLGIINHSKIPTFLAEADVFVLPSLNEGMSNSILEAMACGLPIITTDTGGSEELIKGNGFLVKKESSGDIKKVIKEYLKNRDLLLEHGKNSRKIAEKMKWGNVAKDYFEMY